ncbi:MAG TPA: tetratricopeptide repeat protein [Chthoniobacterales bacterium]|nr:tetratricopeptide repeat protein [Chthoniobacterales bacterium]
MAEAGSSKHGNKLRFVIFVASIVLGLAGALVYWQVTRQSADLKRTHELQQAMLARMLPASDPLRDDPLRRNLTDAEAYRQMLVRELAPQVSLTVEEARQRLNEEANLAARDPRRDAKDKAQHLITAGGFLEAIRLLDDAMAAASPPPAWELLIAKGDAQFAGFDLKESEQTYRQAADLVNEKAQPFPWIAAQAKIAGSLEARARYAEAEPIRSRIVRKTLDQFGADNPDSAAALNNYASVLCHLRRYSDAEPLYRRALTLTEKKFGRNHPKAVAILDNLASLYSRSGNYRQAESLYGQALEVRENALGRDHSEVAENLNNLGELYVREGRYADAESSLQRAIDIWRTTMPENPKTAVALRNLGAAYRNQGKLSSAKEAFEKALSLREKILGPEHPDVARSVYDLGLIYYRQNNLADAEKSFVRARAIQEKTMPDSVELALTLQYLASVQFAAGQPNDAEKTYQREIALREKIQGEKHPGLALALESYAAFLRQIGKTAEAAQVGTRAGNIRLKLATEEE